jgi:molybdopterin-containing oxidoreductase family iron-sulfur binding subunit
MTDGKHKLPVLGSPEEDGLSRRRFLALFGASAALATGAGCKPSGHAVVPYTRKQEEIVPGVASFYASTFQHGEVAYPVLVKAREGRPIHVEGNDEHPRYQGKTSLHATADLLGLYDPDRLRAPLVDGRTARWPEAIAKLAAGLRGAAGKGAVLITAAVLSPSRRALIARLVEAVPGLRHVEWEPAANHNGRQAERALLGEARLPAYRLDQADVILSFEADFLGTFGDTASAIKDFAQRRRPAAASVGMNRLYVLEGGMSLTGSNADVRLPVRPGALPRIAFGLVHALHARGGRPLPAGLAPAALDGFALARLPEARPFVDPLADLVADLNAAGKRALVLAGPAAPAPVHAACLLLNRMLGAVAANEEESPEAPPLASPEELMRLLGDMAAGRVPVAIFWDANPAYDLPADAWRGATAKVPLRVRLGLTRDETAADCNLILPTHHWLESWGDFAPSRDTLTLQQPVVAPLYDTRPGEDVLLDGLAALGRPAGKDYRAFLKQRWQDEIWPKGSPVPFARFWHTCLHDGVLRRKVAPAPLRPLDGAACARAAAQVTAGPGDGFELLLEPDLRLYDGRYAGNGWLQEMPDPIGKTAWGNPLAVAPADADRLGLRNGDLVTLGSGPPLPVLRQPGQAAGVLRLSLGHGRWQGTVAAGIGVRAWDYAPQPGARLVAINDVRRTGGRTELALGQMHDTRDGRDIAQLLSLPEFAKLGKRQRKELPTLYDPQQHPGPRWGMAIDLSACVGCGGCIVACQSENNIPVVGPEQVRKGRAMHWMRVDRYYEGPVSSPQVVHEPMLCQQCDNAPCESVCPVQATNHGPDGINEMAYNRCVGTRYCANNCPYKVRRFNYLDFTSATPPSLELAFNPEVSVRPRGVMEKCTFCVQRIRNAGQVAKREGRGLRDGEVVPACGAACPSGAIVFGDISDPESAVSKLARSNRGFHILEELGARPAITYLAALRNPAGPGHGGER